MELSNEAESSTILDDVNKDTLETKLHALRMRRLNTPAAATQEIAQAPPAIEDLEDPGLIEHMNRARERLADYTRRQGQVPSFSTIITKDIEIRRTLTDIMRALDDGKRELNIATEEAINTATNAQKLAEGIRPHGYPVVSNTPQCLETLSVKIENLSIAMNKIADDIGRLSQITLGVNAKYEIVADNLIGGRRIEGNDAETVV
jgi:hypothetical protein